MKNKNNSDYHQLITKLQRWRINPADPPPPPRPRFHYDGIKNVFKRNGVLCRMWLRQTGEPWSWKSQRELKVKMKT